jgi:hypothetical protein
MLAIINVSKDPTQSLADYEIRINQRVIGTFQHKRTYNGAAQCLRDAADALDRTKKDQDLELFERLVNENPEDWIR